MIGFITPPNAPHQEIWVGESGFKMEVGGVTRGNLFIRKTGGGTPTWGLQGGGEMTAGQAWWHWHTGYHWPANFDLKPLTTSTRLGTIPTGGHLDKFESKTFPTTAVQHPALSGWRTWKLTLRKAGGVIVEVGFLCRLSGGKLRWYAHKDKVSGGSRIDSTSDTLEFRAYTHDTSCETWCDEVSSPMPCMIGTTPCANGHMCVDPGACEAHDDDCGLNNNYRAIVSDTL